MQCTDVDDEHYSELKLMENELKSFVTETGEKYNLIPLPMADCAYEDGERLPATYANFLILNEAVLLPTYNSPKKDSLARMMMQKAFPDKEIVCVDCRALIRQHGSLHCVTMQYPEGVK